MIERSNKVDTRMDWLLLGLVSFLIVVGFVIKIQATTATSFQDIDILDFETAIAKQFIWTIAAGVLLLAIFVIDKTFWSLFSLPIYLVSIALLVLVLVFGQEINGSKSWFVIGGTSFQPTELAKFGTALALSNLLSSTKFVLTNFKNLFTALGMIALPVLLVLGQPDAGSALVFCSFVFVLYRQGLAAWPIYVALLFASIFVTTLMIGVKSTMLVFLLFVLMISISGLRPRRYWFLGWVGLAAISYTLSANALQNWALGTNLMIILIMAGYYFSGGRIREVFIGTATSVAVWGLSLLTTLLFAALKPHQQGRINAWLNPEKCDWDTIYNVMLSKMAISSGGFWGKGMFQSSLTKLNFVPEHTTDFIFCVVGEEYGLWGAGLLIFLFLALIWRILYLAEEQKQVFVRSYFYAVAGIIFVHVLVNIGMTLGVMPVIGIPLPFISYGGSSIIGFTLLLGVLIKLDNRRIA